MSCGARLPISVVIPAYNAQDYLSKALQSVKDQSQQVTQIVVVDDNSTDRTAEIAQSMGVELVRHAKNRGPAAARNTGIHTADQPWIAFLDADDVWQPQKMERQWAVIESHPKSDVIFSDRRHFREGEILCDSYLVDWPPYVGAEKDRLSHGVYRCERESLGKALSGGGFMTPSSLMVRRDLLYEIGLFDETFGAPGTGIGAVEDLDLALRLLPHSDPLVVEEPLVNYRVRDDSVSADDIEQNLAHAHLAEKIERHPNRYPQSAVNSFSSMWKAFSLRRAATLTMHKGNFAEARRLFRRSFWAQPRLKTVTGFLVAAGGRPVYRTLLSIKRGLGLPGLR